MAEAVAVLGALSSILQIIDFVTKLTSHTRELLTGGHDALRETIEIDRLARDYEALAANITRSQPESSCRTDSERSMIEAAKSCQKEAKTLLDEIDGLRVTASSPGLTRLKEGTQRAARYLRKKDAIDRRRRHVGELGALLSTSLLGIQREREGLVLPRVLEDLHFHGMQDRAINVTEAFPATYEWALEHDYCGMKQWLSCGHGIFWITGKPGAGKSTLMKFLWQKKTTSDLLRQWSGNSILVTANFFFWYLGTNALQKSVEGLLRSLLHQLLASLPSLVGQICPEYHQYPPADEKPEDRVRREGLPPIRWTEQELLRRIKQLVAGSSQAVENKMFCFFIDGLDEYNGDHLGLVKLLKDLVGQGNIKLCVSSRPWHVFVQAYERSYPHLRLEDLTKSDIRTYAHCNIRPAYSEIVAAKSPSDVEFDMDLRHVDSLIDEIVQKAEGVFLWVLLVVRSVLRGFAEGDSLSVLRERVARFPPDLEDFFKKLIFDRVDHFYAKQTCQCLTLAFLYAGSEDIGKCQSFLDYWILSRHSKDLEDPQFPFKMQLQELSQQDMDKFANQTRTFLGAVCKDLLVLDRAEDYRCTTKVAFLHRSVYDFLSGRLMQEVLAQSNHDFFKTGRIFHLLNAAKTRFLGPPCYETSLLLSNISNFSLTTTHADLSRDYAALFDETLESCELDHFVSKINYGSPVPGEAVSTLVAFGSVKCARVSLDQPNGTLVKWLAAGLGEHWANPFPLSDIDVSTVSLLATAAGSSSKQLKLLDGSEVFGDAWEMLLYKWNQSLMSCRAESPDTMESLNDNAWEVTKAFLRNCFSENSLKSRFRQTFCRGPGVDGQCHIHEYCSAEEFLKQTISADALAAFPPTFGLVRIEEPMELTQK